MRALSFPVCLAASIVASLALSYVTVFALTEIALQRQLALADQRSYGDLADNLRQDIAAELTGPLVDQSSQLNALLQHYDQFDKDVVGLSVFTPLRVDIADTDPWRIGMPAPANWLATDGGKTDWQTASATETRLGLLLRDPQGIPVGLLVLRYAPDNAPAINAALLRVTQTGLLGLALAALVAVAAILFLARRHRRDINNAIAALSSPSGAIPVPLFAVPTELHPLLQARTAVTTAMADGIHDLTRMGTGLDSKAE